MTEITDTQIEQLRIEAGQAGDTEMVAVCDRALGDVTLEICRCDRGSGGWSLHLDDAAETLVASGDSEYGEEYGDWLRPSAQDYAGARVQVIAAAREECADVIAEAAARA